MTTSENESPERADFDMRPSAVLAIGVAGIPVSDLASGQCAKEVERLFHRLSETLEAMVKSRPTFFSAARPRLRCVSTLSAGGALEAARVARDVGIDLSCVLPFEAPKYLEGFDPRDRSIAKELIDGASACLVLPGTRDEDDRAHDRAYEAIAANVDILLVVLNERLPNPDCLRGLFQSALSSGTPIISIDSENSRPALLLTRPFHDELTAAITDLHKEELPVDLMPLVQSILLPPADSAVRRSLEDLVAEINHPLALRFEYSMMLKLFRVSRIPVKSNRRLPDKEHGQHSPAHMEGLSSLTDDQDYMQRLRRFDALASYYGQLCRSSAATGFLVIIIVAFLSALAGMIFPSLSGASIAIQIAINIVVLLDVTLMKRHRWMERWLDYRAIAERLRCLRFLHPLGLGDVHKSNFLDRKRQSWIDWYVRRCCFALDPPSGQILSRDVPKIAGALVVKEIDVQLAYHRQSFRRFGRLEHRLFVAAYGALAATVMIAVAMGIAAQFVGGIQGISWRQSALLALAVLPAVTTALNGIRADADLVQLVERSALAAVALTRLRRSIRGAVLNYDRMAAAATKVSLLMGDELSEWRFMLENRRLRQSRSSEWRKR